MRQGLFSELAPILAAPWQQRRSVGPLWGLLVIVGIVALIPIGLFTWSLLAHTPAMAGKLRHVAAAAGAVVLAVLTVCSWVVTVSNVYDQNRAALAQLVPAHPTRLRLALVLAAALATAFIALVLGACFGEPLVWATLTVAGLALLAMMLRWPAIWLLGCAMPVCINVLREWPGSAPTVALIRDQWNAQPVAIFLTLAAAATVLIVMLIQTGGARHAASDEARRLRTERFRLRWRGAQPIAVGTRGLFDTVITQPYYVWCRHVLARTSSPVFSRVMLALGPGAHWTAGVTAVVGSALALFAGLLLLEAVGLVYPPAANFAPDALASVSVGILVGMLSPAMQVQARLHQSRREQHLVALLPGVPRGAVLNRRMAWQLTGQFFLTWTGAVALMVLCLATAHALRPEVLRPLPLELCWAFPVAALPMVVLQWRPWSRVRAPTTASSLGPYLLLMLVGAASWGAPLAGWLSLAQVTAVSLGATVAWCAMRWHRMGREPSALPVGRLA
jgi:hypothetical protein